ncbi:MAG: Spy/CpxP family protein refolding chaperone [Deltaproteobacteria bacterium]|nr:Spy/CpxP family protein refolding chaperone [Deltaproteobacteria bacterium]
MKAMSKWKVVGIVTGIMMLLAVGTLYAFGPFSYWGGGRFQERILAHIDDRVEDLNLSESQQKAYEDLRRKLESNLAEAAAARKALFVEIERELNGQNPDITVITGLAKEQFERMPEFMGSNMDLVAEFYNMLDDGQKAQVIAKARKKMERSRQFRSEG